MLSASILAAAAIGSNQVPLTGVATPVTVAPRVLAPPTPPRFMTGPGIKIAGRDLPATYTFPLENTQIDTTTGKLIRQSGYPLPMLPDLVRHSDGNWYQAPTNSWEYVGSPLQPYNQKEGSSPYVGMSPDKWAMLVNDNAVNLKTGEVFNNVMTPVPEIQVALYQGKVYAVPRDPFQFMESPFQPYVIDENIKAPTTIPQNAVGGSIGFSQGYNPYTIDILKEIQQLPLNYNYDLNAPAIEEVPLAPLSPSVVTPTAAPTVAP